MQSLESLGNKLSLTTEKLEASMPSAFVSYKPVKAVSADVSLSTSEGILKKEKKRSPEKTIYEFISLKIWHELLDIYSQKESDIKFRAPVPIGMSGLDQESSAIYMQFLNGYEIKKLNTLKRTTPVKILGQQTPLPLYAACALHLGALNRLKENEGLYHSDYDSRHVIFSPIKDVSICAVDVENSRRESKSLVSVESEHLYSQFEKYTSSQRDKTALRSWYEQGFETLILPDNQPQLDRILESVQKEYDIELDFSNMILNGIRLRSHA